MLSRLAFLVASLFVLFHVSAQAQKAKLSRLEFHYASSAPGRGIEVSSLIDPSGKHQPFIKKIFLSAAGDTVYYAVASYDILAATETIDTLAFGFKELPAYLQSATQVLHSRAGALYWGDINEVPNTPGSQSSIGHILTVHGTGSKDYRWEEGHDGTDQVARDLASAADAQASTNADDIGTNTSNISQLGIQNNNLQSQITQLGRQTADLDIVSDGPGWAEAKAADAGIAIWAEGSTIGDGLLNDNRDLMQADVDAVSQWRQTIALGATVQAVVVRIEGTLGPIEFALQQGDDTFLPIHTSTKVLSDSQWDYFYIAGLSNSRITINRRADLTHTRFHGELAGRALAQLGDGTDQAARAAAAANKAIVDRLSVFSHVHLDPPGISGNDFPTFIGILLSNKIIDKTITRLRITLGGEQLLDAQQPQDLADLNLSGPGVTELSGALLNGALSPTARNNLKSNTQPATQYINCQIQYTFSDGTSATDRTSFGTNNNAFLSSGLNQSEVDARIAALVNDDFILDLARPSRFAFDRGKFLGISDTNQDSIVILDAPTGGGSGGRTEAQVNAQIRAGVQDWAETSNTDAIPRSPKLNNVNDDFILDLAQSSRGQADRGKLFATSPSNENNMVLISPPPVVVVTDRDPEPVKATGTRGTGGEAARNDHVHPLKIATNGGLEFITGDSLRATSSGGGLTQDQVDARVAAGITDDAILDLGEASRTSADRGKVLGVSKTNENAVALLDFDPPVWVQAFTAAAQSVSNANETTVQTVSITPRNASTRVFIQAHIDVSVTVGGNAAARDVGFQLRLYHGSNQIASRTIRASKYAADEIISNSVSIEFLHSPTSSTAQTYTARFIRTNGNRTFSITNRQIVAHEVLQ